MFHVGQEVVCVNDSNGGHLLGAGYNHGLRKGTIYVIDGVSDLGNLALIGIFGHWSPVRFRPIIKRKTDISIFHEILRKHSSPEVVQ